MRRRCRAGEWIIRASLVACLILVQGCLAMIYRPVVLSDNSGAGAPSAVPLPLVVGVKVGTMDGEINGLDERYMLSQFVAKLSAANLFQQITYPTAGREDVMLEIGGKSMIKRPYTPLMVGNVLLCTFTLYLVCFPFSAEYDYTVAVRAVAQADDEEIGRYRATGSSRITFGFFQSGGRDSVNIEGWRLAVTSAYDQLVARIRSDEAGYQRLVKP